MQLSQFLKYYGLEAQELLRLLSENGIDVNLRLVKLVPEEWHQILIKKAAAKPSVLDPEGNDLLDSSELVMGGEVETADKPSLKKGLPKFVKIGEVDLSRNLKQKKREHSKVKKEVFWAYVKFVADDNSHVYVKRLNDFKNLSKDALHVKDSNDYLVKLEDVQLQVGQLIICTFKQDGKGTKRTYIKSESFQGIIKNETYGIKVYDLSSRLGPCGFRVISDFQQTIPNALISFSLKIVNGQFHATQLNELEEQEELNEELALTCYEKLIKKNNLVNADKELLHILESLIGGDSLTELHKKAIQAEREQLKKQLNKPAIDKFLDKWLLIHPELSFKDLDFPVANDFYLERWFKGTLPAGFWGEELVQVFFAHLSENKEQEAFDIFLKFKKVLAGHQEESYHRLLQTHIDQFKEIDSADRFLSLRKLADTAFSELAANLKSELLRKLGPGISLDLWLKNELEEFPRAEALELFSTRSSEEQDRIVEQLEEGELRPLLKSISPANSSLTLQKSRKLLEKEILKSMAAVSLDIESDGEQISELAWGNQDKWFSGGSPKEIKDVQEALQRRLNEDNPLLVGHNITDYDCPILQNKGLEVNPERLWDTLLLEMVLSPDLRNYALKTSHHALDDAALALRLFINQVLRIIALDDPDWHLVQSIFQPEVQQQLEELRASLGFAWIDNTVLKEELLSCLRPQPGISSLIKDLADKLNSSAAGVKVVLASMEFWDELRVVPGIEFYTSNTVASRFGEIEEEAFLAQLTEDPLGQVIAKRFFNHCRQTGIRPLPANLPPIVKVRLSKQVDFAACLKVSSEPDWEKEQIACLDIYDLAQHEEDLIQTDDAEVFVVEPDLISLTFKKLLKEVDLVHMLHNSVTEDLWIKFSGGQSFIQLNKEQAQSLHVEVPGSITNLWIEKYVYGKYRIWGNYKWENHLEGFPPENIQVIEREKAKLPKEQASYLVVDQKRLQSTIGVTRFNPETIYRSRYWLIQKELLSGIVSRENNKRPLVLFIQRKDEVEVLEQYFHALGYYIPDGDIVVGRRLELLHQSKRTKKILVATISEASQIISANYLGPLSVAWDSFNLYENYYLAKESKLFEQSLTSSAEVMLDTQQNNESEGIDEDRSGNIQQAEKISFPQRDIFFLLKLQLPLINRLRTLLMDDDKENKIWLLDARIEDFTSLGDTWNARKEVFTVWDNKESYDKDAELADSRIISPKPETELPFSVEETKEILRKVFLPEAEDWYDYQHDYLDRILPANNNLLVSLPTGGGKSLLFQAPALFRSSFTNRLTVVVTPLKALMEDQVKGLWKLGFYGSVDYINQDKSDEVQQIYRRLAGGELSLLFITPERFRSGGFVKAFSQRFSNDGGLEYAVYDEAHCISQWGHEFRPDYLYSGKAVQRFKDSSQRKFPVLLFSATVSEKVYRDFNLIFK
jgi:hypothetical protein